MAPKFPTPGDVFEDRYRIDTLLGTGGFARVFRGLDLDKDQEVALKILRPPRARNSDESIRDAHMATVIERFQREASMLSQLKSPYTVSLYDHGRTEDGLLYMVLEFIDGKNLGELLQEGEGLEPSRVVKIVTQVLMSLREAHELDVLHRDLKPANVMVFDGVVTRDNVKLLDFGIAKILNESDAAQDLTGDAHSGRYPSLHGARADSGHQHWTCRRHLRAGAACLRAHHRRTRHQE